MIKEWVKWVAVVLYAAGLASLDAWKEPPVWAVLLAGLAGALLSLVLFLDMVVIGRRGDLKPPKGPLGDA